MTGATLIYRSKSEVEGSSVLFDDHIFPGCGIKSKAESREFVALPNRCAVGRRVDSEIRGKGRRRKACSRIAPPTSET